MIKKADETLNKWNTAHNKSWASTFKAYLEIGGNSEKSCVEAIFVIEGKDVGDWERGTSPPQHNYQRSRHWRFMFICVL